MSVHVHITQGPLPDAAPVWDVPAGYGALVTFEGVARPTEDDRPILALEYEAYQPMAGRMLKQVAEEVMVTHGLLGLYVEHSMGRVQPGERSFRLRIASAHREEALAAVEMFITTLKRDVPIWKKGIFEA